MTCIFPTDLYMGEVRSSLSRAGRVQAQEALKDYCRRGGEAENFTSQTSRAKVVFGEARGGEKTLSKLIDQEKL